MAMEARAGAQKQALLLPMPDQFLKTGGAFASKGKREPLLCLATLQSLPWSLPDSGNGGKRQILLS